MALSQAGLRAKPLWRAAAEAGHVEIVPLLLNGGASFSSRALSVAAENGRDDIIRMLLADHTDVLSPTVLSGGLSAAARRGNMEAVEAILGAGAEPSDGVLGALDGAHPEILALLLAGGAVLDDREARRRLFAAVRDGSVNVVRMLLDAGVDVSVVARANSSNEGSTALMVAARQGDAAMVRILLEAGADVDTSHDESGRTALHNAVDGGEREVVQMLIDAGADINRHRYAGRRTNGRPIRGINALAGGGLRERP